MKRLVVAEDVKQASRQDKIVYIGPDFVITPSARDLAAELGVTFQKGPASKKNQNNPGLLATENQVRVIAIASDHGGFGMKQELIDWLRKDGQYIVHDLGPDSDKACDYPEFALAVARAVANGKADRGIMIDSVGIGSAMAANRVPGILAAKCNNAFEARSAREHNYANVVTLGAKIIGIEMAKDIIKNFLNTGGGAERHKRRVQIILQLDDK